MSRKQPDRKQPRWKDPDPERAATTTNHLAEDMPGLVSRMDAMEAAAYWRDRFEAAARTLSSLQATLLSRALENSIGIASALQGEAKPGKGTPKKRTRR